jgi:hypothetical protein
LKRIDGGDALPRVVTVTGTKYRANAHAFIIRASRIAATEEQCLFLVADADNRDGVFLHNGQQRLGALVGNEAQRVRKVIDDCSIAAGQEQVLVCKKSYVKASEEVQFTQSSTFVVVPEYQVYERLARKFSDKYLPKE